MLKIEKFVTASPEQWMIILEGMRNPKNSWDRIDSYVTYVRDYETDREVASEFFMGEKDHNLAMNLVSGGPVHAKFRRMIPVWFTVNAPLFWWKEFDTYKVGTVRNSCSTMHKIHVTPFDSSMFAHEGCDQVASAKAHMMATVDILEELRLAFNSTQDKKYWRAMIEMLPDGFMMKATIFTDYEVLSNMHQWRRNHKVDEWHVFCDWIEELPYSEIITGDIGRDEE